MAWERLWTLLAVPAKPNEKERDEGTGRASQLNQVEVVTMSKNRQMLPLKSSVARAKIKGVAWDLNWLFVDVLQRSEEQPYESIFTTSDAKTRIHYIEDFFIGVHYILAVGPDAETVIENTSNRLDAYDWEDVQTLFSPDQPIELRVEAVYAAGILAPQNPDPDVLEFFRRASRDEEDRVRLAVSIGIGYVGWDACEDIARELAHDSAQPVRKNAELMLEGFEKELHRS